MPVLAPVPVIEPVAVADVEALRAAIAPNRELDEPGEDLRETTVELPRVDLAGDQADNVGAAAGPVAAGAVGVGGLEPGQDPGPVQEIVYQGIDRYQLHANFEPARANVSGADQNARHRHCQDLVGNAVDVAHRLDQANARLRQGIWSAGLVRLVEAVIDPADQVAFGNITNEQVQAVGNLIQVAVSQAVTRQRARRDVIRLGAGAAVFSYRQAWKCQ
jgi:hypothetical protein